MYALARPVTASEKPGPAVTTQTPVSTGGQGPPFGHVGGGLLVACVDEANPLCLAAVEDGVDVPPLEDEGRRYPGLRQHLCYETAGIDLFHGSPSRTPGRARVVSALSPERAASARPCSPPRECP